MQVTKRSAGCTIVNNNNNIIILAYSIPCTDYVKGSLISVMDLHPYSNILLNKT